MTDAQMIQAAKAGEKILADRKAVRDLRCAAKRIVVAHDLLSDAAEFAFDGGSSMDGILRGWTDKNAAAYAWMEQHYDVFFNVCTAVLELMEDAGDKLVDLPFALDVNAEQTA